MRFIGAAWLLDVLSCGARHQGTRMHVNCTDAISKNGYVFRYSFVEQK
jgi:hypothetical protein